MRVLSLFLLGIAVLSVAVNVTRACAASAERHWAFQMPARPPLAGKSHPVDELLAIRQREKNLKPVPDAARGVLLRRAWHVVAGLQPPANLGAEVSGATGEPLSEWSARMIDEVLSSRHYGERWARHWLDVTRYADTKGYDFTAGRLFPFAFTYRDWVIESLNKDLPYDEFLRRQIAADLMDVPIREQAALGFLTL